MGFYLLGFYLDNTKWLSKRYQSEVEQFSIPNWFLWIWKLDKNKRPDYKTNKKNSFDCGLSRTRMIWNFQPKIDLKIYKDLATRQHLCPKNLTFPKAECDQGCPRLVVVVFCLFISICQSDCFICWHETIKVLNWNEWTKNDNSQTWTSLITFSFWER